MDEHEMYYANLVWPQLEARLRAAIPTVLLFPVGATEPHGPHAPLRTDPLISLGMCRRAVQRLEGDPELSALILPSLEFAVTRYAGASRDRSMFRRTRCTRWWWTCAFP
jgi:creatinine amidohydrolase